MVWLVQARKGEPMDEDEAFTKSRVTLSELGFKQI